MVQGIAARPRLVVVESNRKEYPQICIDRNGYPLGYTWIHLDIHESAWQTVWPACSPICHPTIQPADDNIQIGNLSVNQANLGQLSDTVAPNSVLSSPGAAPVTPSAPELPACVKNRILIPARNDVACDSSPTGSGGSRDSIS